MKKRSVLTAGRMIGTLTLLLALILSACQPAPPSTPRREPLDSPTPEPAMSGPAIWVERVQVTEKEIVLAGRSTLPDGTCLLTELQAGAEAVAWWPVDQCATIDEGTWQITVPFDRSGAQPLDQEVTYAVIVQQRGEGPRAAPFLFDLAGPPTPEPVTEPTAAPATEPIYRRIEIPEAELTVEVPEGWTKGDALWRWSPEGRTDRYIGVVWADLQPPMIPEAVMLPEGAQILESEPVELDWGAGSRFLVEVYGPAPEGGERAPVEAVEIHTLIVVQTEAGRRAYDFYGSALKPEALEETIAPALRHMVESSMRIDRSQ